MELLHVIGVYDENTSETISENTDDISTEDQVDLYAKCVLHTKVGTCYEAKGKLLFTLE